MHEYLANFTTLHAGQLSRFDWYEEAHRCLRWLHAIPTVAKQREIIRLGSLICTIRETETCCIDNHTYHCVDSAFAAALLDEVFIKVWRCIDTGDSMRTFLPWWT